MRAPRARPMSARPASAHASLFPNAGGRGIRAIDSNLGDDASKRNDTGDSDNDSDDDGGVVDDDGSDSDGEEFGAGAVRDMRDMGDVRDVRDVRDLKDEHPDKRTRRGHRAAAAVSLSYLKVAAEKKKTRDREFALELLREETEYKKKISLKIDQANKMLANAGSKKLFMLAPDREGVHMIKVAEPPANDRVVSVETFHIPSTRWLSRPSCMWCMEQAIALLNYRVCVCLCAWVLREFERLATIPIGMAQQVHPSSSARPTSTARPSSAKASYQGSKQATRYDAAAKAPANTRLTRTTLNGSVADLLVGSSNGGASGKREAAKAPPDRSEVQEELKSVLASTIELTKVLQDQLHELKLKGWNFTSRSSSAPAAQ